MIGRLIANGISLDLKTGVSFPFNYSVSDMKEPQKRKSNYSKSTKLPGTQVNIAFFAAAYSLSLSSVTGTSSVGFNYDPTIRIPAKYYNHRGRLVFNGLLQLKGVAINDGEYSFECMLFSNLVELFMALGDLKLSELGWSEYDHALTRTNVKNSWATSVVKNGVATPNFTAGAPDGFGYHYGLVDYGFVRSAPKTFKTSDLYPQIYLREAVTKCLEVSGIKWTSTILDSTLVKKMLISYGGGEKQNLPPAEKANRRTQFNGSLNTSISRSPAIYTDGTNYFAYFSWFQHFNSIDSDNGFTPAVVTDIYQQYDATGGQITIERTGAYKLTATQTLALNLDAHGMTLVQSDAFVTVYILRNGSTITSAGASLQAGSLTLNKTVQVQLNAGDVISFQIYVNGPVTYQLTGDASTAQNLDLTITDSPNFSFDLISTQTTLNDGDTVELARFLPDMKASDLLSSVITMMNLYISDPDVEGTVVIEDLENFYLPTDQFDDWTQLLDHSKEITIKPSSSIEGKNYKFSWAEDNDYDNKRYRDKFGIGYGNYIFTAESTFQKGDRDYKVVFAQTVPTDELTPLIVPRIISVDESTQIVKPFKGKPRIFMWNGLKTGGWRLTNATYSSTSPSTYEDLTSWPSVHHFDNWQTPTFDLNFGLPQELYYTTGAITNNNLVTGFHRRFLREMTGKDSKLLNAFFKLSAEIIATLNFRKLKMINGVLFRLNEITDFDDTVMQSTAVEMVKIVEADKLKTFLTLSGTRPAKTGTGIIISPPVETGSPEVLTPSPVPVISGGLPGYSSAPDVPIIYG